MDVKPHRLIHNKHPNTLTEQIKLALPARILLYEQASLSLKNIKELTHSIGEEHCDSLNVYFTVAGELEGKILCTLDLDLSSTSGKNLSVLQGLFVESMNILIGNYLSQLEKKLALLSVMSPPTFFVREEMESIEMLKNLRQRYHSMISFKAHYNLRFLHQEFPVFLYLQLRKRG